jgi:3-hydroxyisobutyrate dehydrogenase
VGATMVRRLVDGGHDVSVLGRTDEKRRAVSELGATPVSGVPEVVDGADVVIVCVFTDEQVQQVCLQDGLVAAMRPGATLVIHTTGSPRTARSIADQFGDIGVLDAPVSGGPHNIAAGEVTLFIGGSEDVVARAQPVLACYGDPIMHVGPLGAGQAVKLINNSLFAAQIGLLAEAVTVGASLGVDEPKLLASVARGSGASRVGEFVAGRGSVAGFVADVGEFIGKDIEMVRKTAAELGTDLGLLDDVINAGIRP